MSLHGICITLACRTPRSHRNAAAYFSSALSPIAIHLRSCDLSSFQHIMVMDTADLRWIATGMILIVSFAGVGCPFLAMRTNEKLLHSTFFQLMRVLCTGLVVSVALLHVLADGQDYLRNVSEYPVADAAALVGIFLMVAIKEMGTMALHYLKPPNKNGVEECLLNKEADHGFGHTHGLPSIELHDLDLAGQPLRRFVVYMMEVS